MVPVNSEVEIDRGKRICKILLARDMCETEAEGLIAHLKGNKDLAGISKFIIVVPSDAFQACEAFRINMHQLVLQASKSRPAFRLAVVTTFMKVVGYERVAKLVLQLVDKEQIFQTLDDAMAWILNE